MIFYFLRRLLLLVPIIFLISLITFFLTHALPGDPASLLIGDDGSPLDRLSVRAKLGLDAPLWLQYIRFLYGFFTGQWGYSFVNGYPTTQLIGHAFLHTALLSITAFTWSFFLALSLGVILTLKSLSRPYGFFIVSAMAVFCIAMPSFWIALMLIQIFAVKLQLLPSSGFTSFSSLLMPAFALGLGVFGILFRHISTSFQQTLQSPYILTAQAKGLSHRHVIWRHALPNALLPIVTMVGIQFGYLLSGAIVVEKIFRFPGLGSLLVNALFARDYPLITPLVLIFALQFLFITFIVDFLYALIDPRVIYASS